MTNRHAVSNWIDRLDAHVTPDLARSALLVIDTQVNFLDGAASAIPGTSIPGTSAVRRACRAGSTGRFTQLQGLLQPAADRPVEG